jgi:hypothetical protein
MTHDPSAVLGPLAPCSEALVWTLQFPTLEAANAAITDPRWMLWFYTTVSFGKTTSPRLLVGTLQKLLSLQVKELPPAVGALFTSALTGLDVYARGGNVPTPDAQLPANACTGARGKGDVQTAANIGRAILQAQRIASASTLIVANAAALTFAKMLVLICGTDAAASAVLKSFFPDDVWTALVDAS